MIHIFTKYARSSPCGLFAQIIFFEVRPDSVVSSKLGFYWILNLPTLGKVQEKLE